MASSRAPSEDAEFFGIQQQQSSSQVDQLQPTTAEQPSPQLLQLPTASVAAGGGDQAHAAMLSHTQRQLASSAHPRAPPGSVSAHQQKLSGGTRRREGLAASVARKRRTKLDDTPAPLGAQVILDEHAHQQIAEFEHGQDPTGNNLKESLKVGLLKKVDQQAIEKVIEMRRKMSMLKFSCDQDLKDAAKEMIN